MSQPRRRASDHVRARPEGLLGRLRLRHKLALILTLAALLPVVGSSTVAVRLVLSGLQTGVRAQTERTLRIALNLELAHIKDVFEQAIRLAETEELPDLLLLDPESTMTLLQRRDGQMMPGMVEITDAAGKVVGRRNIGGRPIAEKFRHADGAESIRRALGFERRVTVAKVGDVLAVRAITPVVDDAFQLRGAVIVSVPLDGDFADRLKAQLAADVLVYDGDRPVASSFVAPDGARELGFVPPDGIAADVLRGGASRVVEASAIGRNFSVGYAPLQDHDGVRLGMLAVAVDEDALVEAQSQAWRSLALGGASAVLLALALSTLLSQRLTRPLGHLHAGALAVARGDLDHKIRPETGDEIGDLAVAFAQMTRAVKENQERLAARMREIVTLHEIGRAVSSVLGLDEVLRKIVDQVAEVFSAERCVLLLDRRDEARDAPLEHSFVIGAGVGVDSGDLVPELGELLVRRGGPARIDAIDDEPDLAVTAGNARMHGALLAVPLEQKDRVLGLLLVNRTSGPFSDGDLRLVATFANQASTAISNARLYEAVSRSSEELEQNVRERTFELVVANEELAHALDDLRDAQAALIHSERMAGLGTLVAGVAHEINSPAAAVQGAIDNMTENVARLARRARELGELDLNQDDRTRFFALVEQLAPRLQGGKVEAPIVVRRQTRELTERLAQLGVPEADSSCRTLVEIGAVEAAYQLAQLAASGVNPTADPMRAAHRLGALVGYLEQYAYLFRNTHEIRTAVRRITRIVGALKGYSHLDQAKITTQDLHEGIENTLIILNSELKYGITVTRKYAALPPVPAYVDELNQVWTNLIHNAVQALGGRGEIVIETQLKGSEVEIAIADNGPGIPAHVMPRIFEPFFTTKEKGEGTGLGLGIVQQIVEKHGGRIQVESKPGATRFSVMLPVAGPPIGEIA